MAKYETTHTAFLGVDLDLLENPIYSDMDVRAAMLYALYKDRAHLSLYSYTQLGNTRFIDKYGVFIIFTNDLAAKALHTTTKMISKFRKQLVEHGLIKVRRNGLKGYKIYVNEVKSTPKNVPLLLPWMNHYVEVKRTVSDWTLAGQLQYWRNLSLASKPNVLHEGEVTENTCSPNRNTSLTPSSLTKSFVNHNGLVDNARTREATQSESQSQKQPQTTKKTNPYHTLPDSIKKSFNRVFGFITAPVAIELHTLIDQANEEMVNYAITSSEGRKITSPISYLKAAITNAVKRGVKCAQDMVNYYNDHVKGNATKRVAHRPKPRYMSEEQAKKEVDAAMQQLRLTNPEAWLRVIQKQKTQSQPKPLIPIYNLGE